MPYDDDERSSVGHYISSIGIQVDPTKIKVILQILVPKT